MDYQLESKQNFIDTTKISSLQIKNAIKRSLSDVSGMDSSNKNKRGDTRITSIASSTGLLEIFID